MFVKLQNAKPPRVEPHRGVSQPRRIPNHQTETRGLWSQSADPSKRPSPAMSLYLLSKKTSSCFLPVCIPGRCFIHAGASIEAVCVSANRQAAVVTILFETNWKHDATERNGFCIAWNLGEKTSCDKVPRAHRTMQSNRPVHGDCPSHHHRHRFITLG